MAANEVEILVKAVTKQAEQAIDGMAKNVDRSMATVNAAIKGAFAFLVGREVIEGFNEIVSAASKSEAAMTELKTSLKLTGDFSNKAVDSFVALSEELQRTTKYTDEQVLSGVAMAKSFGVSNEQAKQLVKAAADLAAVKGIGFEEAVRVLGMTLDGTSGRLKETIPGIRNFTAEQLRAGAAVQYVAKNMSGAAAAAGQTYEGSIIRAKNAFDDILETLGDFIIKNTVIKAAIEQSIVFFGALKNIVVQNQEAIMNFVKSGILFVVKFGAVVLDVFSVVDKIVTTVTQSFEALFHFLENIPSIMGAAKDSIKGLTTEPLKNLNTQLQKAQADRENESNKALEKRVTFYDANAEALRKYSDVIEKTSAIQLKSNRDAADGLKNQKKLIDELTKAQKEQIAQAAIKDPFAALSGQQKELLVKGQGKGIQTGGAIAGIGSEILKGAQGAATLLKGGVAAAANAIAPGFGQVFGEIFSVLAQGPDKVREMIRGFVEAIPVIVQNIIDSLPVLIEELAKAAPKLASSLAANMPLVATKMATELVTHIPQIISEFAKEMLKIPGKFLDELIKGLKDALGFLNPFGGSGGGVAGDAARGGVGSVLGSIVAGPVGGIVGAIGGIFGFQEDRGPVAMPGGTSRIAGSGAGGGLGGGAVGGLGGTQNLTLVMKVGENELAKTMVQLNNRGFRLT